MTTDHQDFDEESFRIGGGDEKCGFLAIAFSPELHGVAGPECTLGRVSLATLKDFAGRTVLEARASTDRPLPCVGQVRLTLDPRLFPRATEPQEV